MPVAKAIWIHALGCVLRSQMPSRRTSLLPISPHLMTTAKILRLFQVLGSVPLAIPRYQTSSFSPIVSPTIPLTLQLSTNQCDTVLHTLKAACIAQPSPSTAFPINPSQIFTLHPPPIYPNSTATSIPAPSSGLSYNAKIAIGITIPLVLLVLISILFLYWYVRIRPRSSKPKARKPRCNHQAHPSIPSRRTQMSNYSASNSSQQSPYPKPLRIRYSPPLTHSSGKRLSPIPSTSPLVSHQAQIPSGLTSWERAGIRNSIQTRGSRDWQRNQSEETYRMPLNSQRLHLQKTRSQLIFDTTNLPPSIKGGGTWKMKSQEDLFG